MTDKEFLKKRFLELANRSYSGGQYLFTDFLNLNELDVLKRSLDSVSFTSYELFGGAAGCERLVARFGSEELCGYIEPFPIECIRVEPKSKKFSDILTHRDFLGALMNLGIERGVIGDIVVRGDEAYIFCLDRMSSYIIEHLKRIKHTDVLCETSQTAIDGELYKTEERSITVASNRADAIAAQAFNLSRSAALELFRQQKVFVNGRCCQSPDAEILDGDIVSVRGYGRFKYLGSGRTTRKGRLSASIAFYIS